MHQGNLWQIDGGIPRDLTLEMIKALHCMKIYVNPCASSGPEEEKMAYYMELMYSK